MMPQATYYAKVKVRYKALNPFLDERGLSLWAAAEVNALDSKEAVRLVSRITGLPQKSILAGLSELLSARNGKNGRRSGYGVGRKSRLFYQPDLPVILEDIFSPTGRGEYDSPLRWFTKSLPGLEVELMRAGMRPSRHSLNKLLIGLGYGIQTKWSSPDRSLRSNRHGQFEKVNAAVREALGDGAPVFSLDSRRTDLLREFLVPVRFAPVGRPSSYSPSADMESDGYPPAAIGNVVFLTDGLLGWWRKEGEKANPPIKRLVIVVDPLAGGGISLDFWRQRFDRLSRTLNLELATYFLPQGIFKWNLPSRVLATRPTFDWHGQRMEGYETSFRLLTSREDGGQAAQRRDEDAPRPDEGPDDGAGEIPEEVFDEILEEDIEESQGGW